MKEIEKIIKEFQNHPAIKFANEEIALNAARSGGKGYEGENLSDWLRRALISYRKGIEAELRKKIEEIGEKAQSFGMSYQTRGLIDKILSLLDDKRQ